MIVGIEAEKLFQIVTESARESDHVNGEIGAMEVNRFVATAFKTEITVIDMQMIPEVGKVKIKKIYSGTWYMGECGFIAFGH